jgi:Flp pilus assembly protein TadD
MGRSASLVRADSGLEQYEPSAKNPFQALGLEFRVNARGTGVIHTEIKRDRQGQPVTELAAEAMMAIGSGTQGRSYVVDRNGYFFQSPISWFTNVQGWDLSPGFSEAAIHFRRPITVQCLFCHVNQVTPVVHTSQRYLEPLPKQLTIGCERCHGPGALHVERRGKSELFEGLDDTIVNPANLQPDLRESVCQQCHILGEERIVRRDRNAFDYRPGLPIHLFFSIFVRPPELVDNRKTVSHVEQMYLSKCFRASAASNKLGCVSCHDPHELPEPSRRLSFYRERCLRCHEIRSSGEVATAITNAHSPLTTHHSPKDNCIECHMPRRASANVAHAAITDHRVVRRPDRIPEVPPESRAGVLPGQIPLLYFHRKLSDANDPEILRDLGIAMINLTRVETRAEVRREICGRALPFLDMAVHRDPDDIGALEAQGYGFWVRGNLRQSLATLDNALARVPEREVCRDDAARVAAQLGQDATAIAHWRKLLAANPWNGGGHYLLAKLLAEQNDWPSALEEARWSVRLEPNEVAPRVLLIAGHLRDGKKEDARREFEVIERLQPPQLEKLRAWFKDQDR